MSVLRSNTLVLLQDTLPTTATACVDAIVAEVPDYGRAVDARLRTTIEEAVQQALSTFLARQGDIADTGGWQATLDGARELGHGEAVSGRSTDALLSAYRVGARIAWQEFSAQALAEHEEAGMIALLAADTFAFIDELSAASLAGHTAAVTQRTQELARRRDHLAAALSTGERRTTLERLADDARWRIPTTLTALVVDGAPPTRLVAALPDDALWPPVSTGATVVLVPDLLPHERANVLRATRPNDAALGPQVPWSDAAESAHRAHRLLNLHPGRGPLDADDHLVDLLVDADVRTARHLARRAVEPLADLSPTKQEVLLETLLTWLLLQGRREDTANALHVHPQTVRYRMAQLRDLYGDRLASPAGVRDLLIGLVAADLLPGDAS